MRRRATGAGIFYPRDPNELKQTLDKFLQKRQQLQNPALAIILPHAAYSYSGKTVASVLNSIQIPNRIIIIGPNHEAKNKQLSIISQGKFETPLGDVAIDEELSALLKTLCPQIKEDHQAHIMEHAIEVELPFFQQLNPKIKVVPLLATHLSLQECKTIGTTLAKAISSIKEPILLIASTDLNQHIPAVKVKVLDQLIIGRLVAVDPQGLFQTVEDRGISMCGVTPTTITLFAAKALGAKKGTLVHYTNSAELSGNQRDVVGYAGVIIR